MSRLILKLPLWRRVRSKLFLAATAGFCLYSCAPGRVVTPDATATATHLAGVYVADYALLKFSPVRGQERIVLRADGTYQQTYDNAAGYIYAGDRLPWFIDSAGRLHLQQGRFFGGGDAEGKFAGSVLMVDRDKVTMVDELILTVAADAAGHPLLYSPLIGDPDSNEYLKYMRLN